MKKILSLTVFITAMSSGYFADCQDTLVFSSITNNNNNITCPSGDQAFVLPLIFKFDMSYKRHEISFFRDKELTKRIGVKAAFGVDGEGNIDKDISGDKFLVKIKSDSTISFMNEEGIPTGDASFFIQIDKKSACGPYRISGQRSGGKGSPVAYQPGYLFYDAITLNRLSDQSDNRSAATIRKIFDFYGIKDSGALKDNPFFDYSLFIGFFRTFKSIENTGGGGISSIISSIGGLDVTNIADGLAKFLVKRAKQELTMAFFDKLKKAIERAEDLQTLFPQTSYLLMAMGDEIYNYEAYVQNLREAFKDDIKNLPHNFPGIIDNHKGPGDFFNNQHQELEAALRTACYVVNALQEQTHPGDILDNYPVEFLDPIPNKNYKGAVQTLQLISAALKDSANSDTAPYWVNIKKVREMANDKNTLKIYLGLIYQKAKTNAIMFDKGFLLTKLMDPAAKNFDKDYDAYKRYIQGFATRLDGLNKMVKNYDKPETDSATLELYAKYFTATVDMIEYCTAVSDLPHFSDSGIGNLHKELRPCFNIAYAVADLTMAISRKNYSAAINKAVVIYDEVIAKKSTAKSPDANTRSIAKKVEEMKKLSKETGIGLVENDVQAIPDSVQSPPRRTLLNLARYGSFMASVATAKSSDEAEAAIEAFALPAGSSKIKRETAFNVALNGYAGFFYGHELIPGIKDKHAFNSYGVTAPVGVSISIGRRQLLNPFSSSGHSSYSLFVSLVDVGAIASYRINNDSVSQIPTIQLKDIFSPGVFLSIGIPKTPLSLNLGAQFGPNLRKVKSAQNDYSDKTYTRLSASLCVDIPIFNFYTKTDKN